MNDLFNVASKVVVITGGNTGIGFSLAKGFAAAGAQVVVANRSSETGESAAKAVGGGAVYIPCDLSVPESIQSLIDETINRFGRIDVLINNAATRIKKMGIDHTAADWNEILTISVTGSALAAQAAAVHMAKQGGGKIIYLSSISAVRAFIERTSYCASKAAVEGLARSQAAEWAQYNIQVNCISPGNVAPLNPAPPNSRSEVTRDHIPAGRAAGPDDMVGPAIFLSSRASDYVTGQSIMVDGGWSTMTLPYSLFPSARATGPVK